MMPPQGAAARSEVSATLSGVAHERFTADEIGRLLDELAPLEAELDYDSDDASLIRVTRRDWEKARRVPAELAADWAREAGKAHVAWLEAREANDFSVFRPALQRVHDVALRWAEHMEPGDSPYDAFLDEYEPGMKTAEVKAVFDVLRPELTAIVREAGEPADDSFLEGDFPVATQQEFLDGVLRDFGFEEDTYRLDPTVHPFATTFSRTDIRMTTRYKPTNLRALWAAMHEAGHGLTYLGTEPSLGALAAVRERLARARRVAEPHLGEPRRPLAAVLARPPPGAAAALPAARVGRPRRPGTAASTASPPG